MGGLRKDRAGIRSSVSSHVLQRAIPGLPRDVSLWKPEGCVCVCVSLAVGRGGPGNAAQFTGNLSFLAAHLFILPFPAPIRRCQTPSCPRTPVQLSCQLVSYLKGHDLSLSCHRLLFTEKFHSDDLILRHPLGGGDYSHFTDGEMEWQRKPDPKEGAFSTTYPEQPLLWTFTLTILLSESPFPHTPPLLGFQLHFPSGAHSQHCKHSLGLVHTVVSGGEDAAVVGSCLNPLLLCYSDQLT